MFDDVREIISGIALFLFGLWLGYGIRLQRHMDEVREWQAIARKGGIL